MTAAPGSLWPAASRSRDTATGMISRLGMMSRYSSCSSRVPRVSAYPSVTAAAQ